jgi:hypothetical protein
MDRDRFARRPNRAPDDVVELGDHSRAQVRVWRSADRLVVEVAREGRVRAHRRVLLRFRDEPMIEGVSSWWDRWTMVAGLPPVRAARRDPFQLLVRDAAELVLRGLPEGRPPRERDRASARRLLVRTRKVFRDLAVASALACDSSARAIALRFSPCMRWWVYRQVVGDDSCRIGQLACTCPGALVFAFALREHAGFVGAAEGILIDARRGTPLPRLLGAAVDRWRGHAPSFVAERGPSSGAAWLRFFSAEGPELDRLCAQQRLLVRRAGARVAPSFLLTPPPLAFAPEDIPSGARRNARWYRAMKGSVATLAGSDGSDSASRVGAVALVSRWAGEIPGNHLRPSPAFVRMLVEYCAATRRVPSRETDATRLVTAARQWAGTVGDIAREQGLPRVLPASVLEIEIPDVEHFSWSAAGVVVVPLRTVREILAEADTMHHCVASCVGTALARECVLLHATVGEEEITLQVQHRAGMLVLAQAAGLANARVSIAGWRGLEAWMQSYAIMKAQDVGPESIHRMLPSAVKSSPHCTGRECPSAVLTIRSYTRNCST